MLGLFFMKATNIHHFSGMNIFVSYKYKSIIGLIYLKEVILIKLLVCVNIFFCYCLYFLEVNFRFQPKVCDDSAQKAISYDDVAIVSIKRNYYRISLE